MKKNNKYVVIKTDLTNGRKEAFFISATTPKGASMKVNRDHWERFCFNKVYALNDETTVLYESNMN